MVEFKNQEEYQQWKENKQKENKTILLQKPQVNSGEPKKVFWTNGEYTASETVIPRNLVDDLGNYATAGCLTSFLSLIVGGLVTLIPVVGWIVGPFIIMGAFISPFLGIYKGFKENKVGPSVVRKINGPCPYCGVGLVVTVANFDGFAKAHNAITTRNN